MQYLIVFLEGIITFISPCLLPMLPVYLSYFAGGDQRSTGKTVFNALGFILGFTLVFVLMGLFAGSLGSFFTEQRRWIDLVMGAVVIAFGLSILGVFRLPHIGADGHGVEKELGFFSAISFGMVFSLSWTPCVGAFLGSALALASQQGSALQGVLMLLLYSAGLGIPFLLSALFIHYLKGSVDWIKRHYKTVNTVAGALLILVGIAMMAGLFNRLLGLLS